MFSKQALNVAGNVKAVNDKDGVMPKVFTSGGDPLRPICISDSMMLGRIILVGLHKVLLTLLPNRQFTLMNEMSLFSQLCPFTIHFPTLMHTCNFDFPAFFLLPLAFRIKSINFNEDNILF